MDVANMISVSINCILMHTGARRLHFSCAHLRNLSRQGQTTTGPQESWYIAQETYRPKLWQRRQGHFSYQNRQERGKTILLYDINVGCGHTQNNFIQFSLKHLKHYILEVENARSTIQVREIFEAF